ncbi:Cation channel sperm-associated protein 4 [Chytridiales sp. JEL 0842]|nr:Cation channel sperm-associated protein 4 [Chytridiales sp. JEL 0842]
MVAIVVSNLQEAYTNERKEQSKNRRILKSNKNSTQGQKKYQRPVREAPKGDEEVWKNQIPYEIPDFDKIPKGKIENYLLILSIMEENMREFTQLKEKLTEPPVPPPPAPSIGISTRTTAYFAPRFNTPKQVPGAVRFETRADLKKGEIDTGVGVINAEELLLPPPDDDENTDAYTRNVTKLETKYINFTDVVDINDHETLENHVSEDLAARFGDSLFFKSLMLSVIVLNSLMIAIQTNEQLSTTASDAFMILDYIFTSIFLSEILFKWYYGFLPFWKNPWNVFDVLIVGISLAGPLLSFIKSARTLRIFRVMRAFRSLRSLTVFRGLQTVVQVVVDSIPDMLNVIILLMILIFIWALVGVALFSDSLPRSYGDFPKALFSLFAMTTQIGWLEDFEQLEKEGRFVEGAFFFTSFMIVGVFILAKIMVAVVVSNLQEAYEDEQRYLRQHSRALKSTNTSSTQGQQKCRRGVRPPPRGDEEVWKGQIPFEIPDFDKISKGKIENYLLVLSILEENLREFAELKEKIEKIQFEVKFINESDEVVMDNDEDGDREQLEGLDRAGDALSRWIERGKVGV